MSAIAVSSVREVTVTLKAAAPSETVNVAEAEFLDHDAADRSGQRGASGRDQQPGLADAAARRRAASPTSRTLRPGPEPVEPSDPTKARITAVSTGGSSGLNNDLSVDGGDNSDDWIGGFLQNFSPDAIQEFAMRTANEDADTGGTTAGSVVITTKRGTNDWHGSGAFYDRAASLNARFPIENPAPNCEAAVASTIQNYRGRTTWAIGGRWSVTRSGCFRRSSMCMRMRASRTARQHGAVQCACRNWLPMA